MRTNQISASHMAGAIMNLNKLLHTLSLYILVITCDVFYTLLLMWGIEMTMTLNTMTYWISTFTVFGVVFFLSVRYSVPELRKVW